ncbi:MAG: sensor histidine kinase KdpD [Planctomycetaceae bacterium]|nr:sensor histidine kinase KdpD [Planctomycetaceae bacterium]
MSDARPNPDELLARVQADEAKCRRGKLKIFFGAAPGVGKTYAMLEAARKMGKEGRDVVVGYIEPHARPETQALVLGLDVLPKRAVTYRGRQLLDFNLPAALALRPELLIVDELAHTNVVGDDEVQLHAKRWQDIEALLAAGIDVYTTVNVQHLESLNDIIAKITGVVVRETVPDAVFEQADEVELVDLAPDDLIERLHEGKVYVPDQAVRATQNFFGKGNLIALRELALRKMAERVETQMTAWRSDQAIQVTWPAADRLLVCVSPGPTSASLVRATRRMAASLRAAWLAVHVEGPADTRLKPADRERLAETLHLARTLGGEVVTLGGSDVAGEIIAYARQRNVTKIIVGKTLQPRWRELLRGSFVYELARRSGDIDVYVISGESKGDARRTQTDRPRISLAGYGAALAAVLVCTLLCWLLFGQVSEVTLAMIYLAGVVIVAAWYGRGPSICASVLGVLAFDVVFVEPRGTLAVSDAQYLFTFAVMLATGVLISTLTSRLAFQAELARRRERHAGVLHELARSLVQIEKLSDLALLEDELRRLVQGDLFVMPVLDNSAAGRSVLGASVVGTADLARHEAAVADWVLKHGTSAGLGTETLPSVPSLFVPLSAASGIVGVLGVRPAGGVKRLMPDHQRLIETVASQLALAVERIQTAESAKGAQLKLEQERLRSALLSAVSHDLRTPLAAIAGAGSSLAESGHAMPAETRRELAESIVAESERLNRLVGNLLDMTRLEAGSMELARDWHPIDELIGGVLQRLRGLLGQRRVVVEAGPTLPLVFVDELLFHQVLANLLENAIRYTDDGGEIHLAAGLREGEIWLEIADNGRGLAPGDEERVFEKFYRGADQPARTGTGLGLAICRGIVELHGGTITARNGPGGGAAFRLELPQPQAPALPPLEEASMSSPPRRKTIDAAKQDAGHDR